MSRVRKLVATMVTSLLVGVGLFATAGVSAAAGVYQFRLSQFSAVIARICLTTDLDQVCVTWGVNKSEVFDLRANRLDNWHCSINVFPAPRHSAIFSRHEFKECGLFGDTAAQARLELVRPDGSHHRP